MYQFNDNNVLPYDNYILSIPSIIRQRIAHIEDVNDCRMQIIK